MRWLGRSFIVVPEVRDRRLDSRQKCSEGNDPEISFGEVREVSADNHAQKDAAPFQQADVDHRPYFRSEELHRCLLGISS